MSSAGPHNVSSTSTVEVVPLPSTPGVTSISRSETSEVALLPTNEISSTHDSSLAKTSRTLDRSATSISLAASSASASASASTAQPSTETVRAQTTMPMFADDTLSVDSEGVIIPAMPTVSSFTASLSSPTNPTIAESQSSASQQSSSVSAPVSASSKITSTLFTSLVPSATVSTPTEPAMTAGEMNMIMGSSSSGILDSKNRLFPLVITGIALGGILTILLSAWIYVKVSRRRKRMRHGTILSFSPITPYPFDARAHDDLDSPVGEVNTSSSRRVPSFYHESGLGIGVASTKPLPRPHQGSVVPSKPLPHPRIEVDHVETVLSRSSTKENDGFDTFNCAMYPTGTCPLEHEKRMREIQTRSTLVGPEPGSPVPSFQTGRMDQPDPNPNPAARTLTPPKIRHEPPPLVFSPSIDQWTHSVRGFTPRRSNTISTGSGSRSSASSLYVPERL